MARIQTSFGCAFAVAISATYACSNYDDNPFREDVLTCEEAVARLARCCDPSFTAERVACAYSWHEEERGCNGPTTKTAIEPALSIGESTCVVEAACDDLVERGVCERANAAFPYHRKDFSGSTSSGGGFFSWDGRGHHHEPAYSTDDTSSHVRVCP